MKSSKSVVFIMSVLFAGSAFAAEEAGLGYFATVNSEAVKAGFEERNQGVTLGLKLPNSGFMIFVNSSRGKSELSNFNKGFYVATRNRGDASAASATLVEFYSGSTSSMSFGVGYELFSQTVELSKYVQSLRLSLGKTTNKFTARSDAAGTYLPTDDTSYSFETGSSFFRVGAYMGYSYSSAFYTALGAGFRKPTSSSMTHSVSPGYSGREAMDQKTVLVAEDSAKETGLFA
jgi:hypothetical protein